MSATNAPPTPAEIVAQTVVNYYHQLTAFVVPVSERMTWYNAQSSEQQAVLSTLVPYMWELLPSFRRYALEVRGRSMRAYMAEHLTPDELKLWIDDGDGGVRPI